VPFCVRTRSAYNNCRLTNLDPTAPASDRIETLRLLAIIALTLWAVVTAASLALAEEEEREYLRLRPHKEPNTCVGSAKGECAQVAAPRINEQPSTIPGVAHPDFGRPRVFVLPPPTPRAVAPYRSFGGNRGITGGM